MKVIKTRQPVIRKCGHCWSEVELELKDIILVDDTVVAGHTWGAFRCPVCGKQGTAYWGLSGDYPIPGEWYDKLFPRK